MKSRTDCKNGGENQKWIQILESDREESFGGGGGEV